MKIRTIIRLAGYSKFSLLFAFAFFVLLFTGKAKYSWFYPVETLLAICCLSLIVFWFIFLPWALKHSKEPEILYAILDKLGMTYILFSKFSPTESYRPSHLNSQFLIDNELATEIFPRGVTPTPGARPLMTFTENGLAYDQWQLSWKDIYDWRYEPSIDGSSENMIIKY